MTSLTNIRDRWNAFLRMPYPHGYSDEVDDVNMVMLDSSCAGCVSTFLGNGGTLDADKWKILKSGSEELRQVVTKLTGPPKDHFEELLKIVEMVLQSA